MPSSNTEIQLINRHVNSLLKELKERARIKFEHDYSTQTINDADGWNERVGITGERTQVQEIAAWLAKQDNGADSALILAFEKEHAELLSLVKDLKACLLSMTPTEFTDAEFCIATLDKTNKIILKHSGA